MLLSLLSSRTNADQKGQTDEEHVKRTLVDDSEGSLNVCGPDYYFKAKISMISSDTSLSCGPTELNSIGVMLDKEFDSVLSIDGALSNVMLESEICPVAKQPVRRDLRTEEEDHREMAYRKPITYTWGGRGTCRLCALDNADKRLLFEDEVDRDRTLREQYMVIDFNTNGKGEKLTQSWVRDEWHSAFGMRVTVEATNGGYAPFKKVRVFNSSKPTGLDFDLGTPNQKCPGGGPGIGIGGEPNQPGENCIPQGNVLIVQEANTNTADDNRYGGEIAFTFDSPTRVGHLGILDIDEGSSWLEVLTADMKTMRLDFTAFGDNSAQLIHVDQLVRRLKVVLKGSGAVTEIGIFRPTNAEEALSPELRSYIANKSPVAEYLPYLEFDISFYLTTKINELFGRKAGSCIYGKWVVVDVQLDYTPNLRNIACG